MRKINIIFAMLLFSISVTAQSPVNVLTTKTQTITNKTIVSPTLTGTPLTPTVTANDNSNKIASTSYVDAIRTQTVTSGITTKTPSEDAVYNYVTAHSSTVTLMPSNQSTTLTTATAVNSLSLSLEANSVYIIRGYIRNGSTSASGSKFGATFPTGSVCSLGSVCRANTDATVSWNNYVTSNVLTNAVNTQNSTGGSLFIDGSISVGSTSGDFNFIFAAVAGTTTIYTNGTYIEFIKVQ